MANPKTKTELNTLINNYIADGSPNILAVEHKEIETEILNRVDARVLTTGTFTHVNNTNFLSPFINFTKPVYTTNYLVNITPYDPAPYTLYSYRTSWAITNKTTTGFTAQLKRNGSQGSGRFFYVVINLSNTI